MLRQGHPVALYCYAAPQGVPLGVEIRDAEPVVPEGEMIRHRNGSVALFANRFRYELQRRNAGTWLDCDAYLLAPLDDSAPYLIGEEELGMVANGVLRMPADSPLLAPLLKLFEETHVPPWLPWRARVAAQWRMMRTGRALLSQMPWGVAGPRAMTALMKEHGLYHWALPSDILYPVHWRNAHWITDPDLSLEQMITSRTVSIHLFNEIIRGFKNDPAPAGSFLARIQEEGRE